MSTNAHSPLAENNEGALLLEMRPFLYMLVHVSSSCKIDPTVLHESAAIFLKENPRFWCKS